jgi:predicted ester cyclase
MTKPCVSAYIDYFERLQPTSLEELSRFFAASARFTDPFNDAHGVDAIRRVFEHMFATCENPVFRVDESVGDGPVVYLRWRFDFGPAQRRGVIHGVSRVRFDAQGLVAEHIDYWDPSAQVYERIPLLGALLRRLRHKLSADGHQARPPSINRSETNTR